KSSTVGRILRSATRVIMKITLITVGLLATGISQAAPAFARGGILHLLAPSRSQHVKSDEGTQPCKEYGRRRSGSAHRAHRRVLFREQCRSGSTAYPDWEASWPCCSFAFGSVVEPSHIKTFEAAADQIIEGSPMTPMRAAL